MSEPFDLLVVGDANPDVILQGPPAELAYGQAEQLVESGTLTVGGSAAILACAAAKLGLRTAFVGVVGDDAAGRFMLTELRARGIDVDAMIVQPSRATGLTVALTRRSDRAILTSLGCMDALNAGMVDFGRIHAARHLHVSSFFLLPGLARGVRGLFHEAHRAGAGTSLDTNWDPSGAWEGPGDDIFSTTDILFVNDREAIALAGVGHDLEAATLALAARGPLPVVKHGAHGAVAYAEGRLLRAPALPVPVADTVGAGDTFDAGFLCGWLRGYGPQRSLDLAAACGSLSARGTGGVARQPRLDEALAALEEAQG